MKEKIEWREGGERLITPGTRESKIQCSRLLRVEHAFEDIVREVWVEQVLEERVQDNLLGLETGEGVRQHAVGNNEGDQEERRQKQSKPIL